MNIRAASLALAFTIVSLPAYAQGGRPPGAGETIQSLANQLEELEARVAKLESGQVDAADLVGTYALNVLGVELGGGNPAYIGVETSVGIMTLNADGTGSATFTDGRCDLQQAMPSVPWVRTCGEQAGSLAFTWTLENGRFIIRKGDGEELAAPIGAGGRVWITGGTALEGGFSNLVIAVRLPNQ